MESVNRNGVEEMKYFADIFRYVKTDLWMFALIFHDGSDDK